MKKFSDDSAVTPACRLIGQFGTRWALLTLMTLDRREPLRFGELRRALPGNISERMLASTLDDLEAAGLVVRTLFPEVPPRVEYRLAPRAASLLPIVRELIAWAEANSPE